MKYISERFNTLILPFILLFLVSCKTITKTEKQLKILNDDICNLQCKTEETKKTIETTKETIKVLNKKYPLCEENNKLIENQINILDLQIQSLENDIKTLITKIDETKTITLDEITEFKRKNRELTITIIIQRVMVILILIIIIFGRVKYERNNT